MRLPYLKNNAPMQTEIVPFFIRKTMDAISTRLGDPAL
jgi:hypothetical protein